MKTFLKWTARAALTLVGVAALTVLGAVGASEAMIRRSWSAPAPSLVAAHDAGAAARGRRLAARYGCMDCHGAALTGRLFFDQMPVGRIWAPNLTLAAARQSDAELARAIRAGVAADGRALWIMPSEAFSRLSDSETADLIAFVRSEPEAGAPQPASQFGPLGRIGVLAGKFRSAPRQIAEQRALAPADMGPAHARGRALARACMECHGVDLKGGSATGAPDLSIAAAYDFGDFDRLMRTGVAAGGRRLGLMSDVAPLRFASLAPDEMRALHDYLKARAGLGN
ncbi:c-type cytochrome [Phenylobacterium sp.]|uniref:c-type cytochrome n=1 Tax=Phenylobacterium sp. TaxID=1871053 RepID=UPI0035AF29DF